ASSIKHSYVLCLKYTKPGAADISYCHCGSSVDLSCTPEQTGGAPVSLYLTHRCVRPEREVLFMAKDRSPGTVRVNRLYKDRLKVTGGLNSDLLNVTIAHLQRTDTGLYICEFVYTADPSDRTVSGSLEFFLFVDGTESVCQCSSYPPLIYTISAAAGLLLLVLICLCAVECVSSLINPNLTTIPQPSMLMSKFKCNCYSRNYFILFFRHMMNIVSTSNFSQV
uniref:Immunoglobulin V-set domain-containing protein n=1 Tax=Oncorhynchus mykiss TaxID=8022 RepID=A0A8C7RRS1_ONCMY